MRKLALAALAILVLTACGSTAPRGGVSPGATSRGTPDAGVITPTAAGTPFIWPATTPRTEPLPATTPRTEPPPATTPRTEPPPPPSPPCVLAGRLAPRDAPSITKPPERPPAPPLGVAVQAPSQWQARGHQVVVFDTAGKVLARASVTPRTQLSCDRSADRGVNFTELPIVTTSAARVFYLDGDNRIRFLDPDGTVGTVGAIALATVAEAMIAISPDESKLAVATFDFGAAPIVETLSVIDLGSGSSQIIGSFTAPFVYPVGWHQGRLVAGRTGLLSGFSGFYSPYPSFTAPFVLIDPAQPALSTVGSANCTAALSLPSSAGFLCRRPDTNLVVRTWAGEDVATLSQAGIEGSLSPDGSLVAVCCFDGANMRFLPGAGAPSVDVAGRQTPGYAEDGGWIDRTHVVSRRPGSASQTIFDVGDGTVTDLGALIYDSQLPTVLVARLPGGL